MLQLTLKYIAYLTRYWFKHVYTFYITDHARNIFYQTSSLYQNITHLLSGIQFTTR